MARVRGSGVDRRAQGESISDEALVVAHPELMPELGGALEYAFWTTPPFGARAAALAKSRADAARGLATAEEEWLEASAAYEAATS